jgi:hypothetical protein
VRNISFALTTEQILAGTKTVTRRLGWERAKVGDLLRPVRKGMGLKPGEKIEVLRSPIRIIDIRREPLRRMTDDIEYGIEECKLEGFGEHPVYCWPSMFVEFFCASHRPCTPSWTVTRLQFEYTAERT